VHHEPPEVAWPEPELEVGLEAGLLRPLELPELVELEPDESELDEPESELEEPELDEPELELEELVEPALDVLELADFCAFVLVEAPAAPGRDNATAPAASTLASPTVAVVVTARPLARRRAATPRATASGFWLFMS
jgi:hypothetical protein